MKSAMRAAILGAQAGLEIVSAGDGVGGGAAAARVAHLVTEAVGSQRGGLEPAQARGAIT